MPVTIRVVAENIRRSESEVSITKSESVSDCAWIVALEDAIACRACWDIAGGCSRLKEFEWIQIIYVLRNKGIFTCRIMQSPLRINHEVIGRRLGSQDDATATRSFNCLEEIRRRISILGRRVGIVYIEAGGCRVALSYR